MSRQGKKRPRTVANVKSFWNKEASFWGDNPRVTIRDHYFRLLEIDTICYFINKRRRVFDIGCGTGFSSLFYARYIKELIGADFAEKMVEYAQKFLVDKKYFAKIMREYAFKKMTKIPNNITFEIGNILDIKYKDNFFDGVITERVLINLPMSEQHYQGVDEVVRVLSKKGIWVLVEVTSQGHKQVDAIRQMFGLSPIEKYWHNLYVNEPEFEIKTKQVGLKLRKKMYFETYQFLTKVIHPLVTHPADPEFISGFNKAAYCVAYSYPEYIDVKKIGLETLLKKHFRDQLKKFESQKLKKYDELVPAILEKNPDFTGCSHQVLYVFDKNNEK